MASKRVLIVDDEENIGRSLRMILEREGYARRLSAGSMRGVSARTPMRQRADALPVRRATAGRQRHRPAACGAAERQSRAGDHDFRARHHRRRGGSHARRGFRFSGEAAEPRQGAAGGEERAGALHPARRRTSGCANWWGSSPKMIGSSPAFQRAVEQATHGGALRCARAADRRIGHGQGTAGGAHSPERARSRRDRS